jgi:hypothetical protein
MFFQRLYTLGVLAAVTALAALFSTARGADKYQGSGYTSVVAEICKKVSTNDANQSVEVCMPKEVTNTDVSGVTLAECIGGSGNAQQFLASWLMQNYPTWHMKGWKCVDGKWSGKDI